MIRDRDTRLTFAFDAVFAAAGLRIIKTPVRAPRANAIAGRWIASTYRECLDRMLIAGERHLRLVLSEYVDHDNTHRPHRTLRQNPPARRPHPPGEARAETEVTAQFSLRGWAGIRRPASTSCA